MAEIVAIPLNQATSTDPLADVVGARFGRAPAFLLIETSGENPKVIVNDAANAGHGAGPAAATAIAEAGATNAVAPHFGPKATDALNAFDMKLWHGAEGTPIREVLAALRDGSLEGAG